MKRRGTYLLLFVVMFSNLPVSQLSKFPTLLKHFQEHRQRDPRVGFIDYLAMHYWAKEANDHDEDRDRELPFKKDAMVAYSAYVPFHPITIAITLPAEPFLHIYPDINEPFHSDAHLRALFRPPQFIV